MGVSTSKKSCWFYKKFLKVGGVNISGAEPEPAAQEQEVEKVPGASSELEPVTTTSEKTSVQEPVTTKSGKTSDPIDIPHNISGRSK